MRSKFLRGRFHGAARAVPVRIRTEIQEGTARVQNPLSVLRLCGPLEAGGRTLGSKEAKKPKEDPRQTRAGFGIVRLFPPGLCVRAESTAHSDL
jgi:hypothetical protein